MLRWRVIERDLFAGGDIAQREEEHAAVRHAAEAVRRAGVVDERGGVAAAAGVDAGVIVELTDAHLAASRDAARGFAVADAFAFQFADFLPGWKSDGREAAFAVNAGALR